MELNIWFLKKKKNNNFYSISKDEGAKAYKPLQGSLTSRLLIVFCRCFML